MRRWESLSGLSSRISSICRWSMRRWSSRKASAFLRLAPDSTTAIAAGSAAGAAFSGASLSDMQPRQFGLFGGREIEGGGAAELRLRLFLFARVQKRLAPFQVQAAPVGSVFFRFRELLRRQVRLVPGHQRLAPAFQRIGEMRALAVGDLELSD